MTRDVLQPDVIVCKHIESSDWRNQQKNAIHEKLLTLGGKCLFSSVGEQIIYKNNDLNTFLQKMTDLIWCE